VKMKILFLHGWQSVPGGVKPSYLAQHGHEVINPKLPDEEFNLAVEIAQAEFDKHQPQAVVGSSRGGAVAMNIKIGEAKLVLLCPAWKKWGMARTVRPGTVILHSRADDVVPFADSEELARTCGAMLIEVGNDHRLADPEPLAAMLKGVRGMGEQVMNDRRRGALIGLAVGDALGAAVEFFSPGSFAPVTGYRSGGPHGLKAGEWTDDTSLALALADSIATVGWDLNDQASRYVEWWKTGKYSVNGRCFDIGITTRSALSNFIAKKNALTSGDRSERASGNGSIMRLAPVPIRYAAHYPKNIEEISRLADESSLPTHASDQCVSACRYLATVLAALISGEDRDEVLSPKWKPLQQLNGIKPLHPLIHEVAQGSYRKNVAIKGSGWVVKSLEAALWAFHDSSGFEEAVLRAVNLGDDADTTGAICGQLAGAYWGESGISGSLRAGLARMDMIEEALEGIL
jgi:ADP-ribosyl-[dinitrogen reductase] hydrolase